MSSVNEVRLLGNLGADPETRKTSSGTAVANLSVATHRAWTDDGGERQENTEWHRVVAWGQQASFAEKFLSRGDKVYVSGRLQHRQYTDSDGNERNVTEVVARRLIGLSPRGEGRGAPTTEEGDDDFSEDALMSDDELPF